MFDAMRKAKGRMQLGPFIEQSKYLLLHHGIHMAPADWEDPYLYGYFSGATFVLLKAGSQGKLEGASIAAVQAWGWLELTTLPERLYLTRTDMLSGGRSEEWKSGSEGGILWSLLTTGRADRSAPKVREAIEAAGALKRLARGAGVAIDGGDHLQDAAAFVFQRDWFEYIAAKKREAA